MGKIFFVMGKSATGKDTIFKTLVQDQELSLRNIVPYTTRPIRSGEVNGIDYVYVTEKDFQKLLDNNKIIEYRSYDTMHGVWRYFTVEDEHINLKEYDYIVVGTLESYLSVCAYFGQDIVVPIMITVEDGTRLERALKREKQQQEPKYEELCRRFLADSIDYAAQKVIAANIIVTFENEEMDTCIQDIKKYIKGFYGNI